MRAGRNRRNYAIKPTHLTRECNSQQAGSVGGREGTSVRCVRASKVPLSVRGQPSTEPITCNVLSKPHNSPVKKVLLSSPFYRGENQDPKECLAPAPAASKWES